MADVPVPVFTFVGGAPLAHLLTDCVVPPNPAAPRQIRPGNWQVLHPADLSRLSNPALAKVVGILTRRPGLTDQQFLLLLSTFAELQRRTQGPAVGGVDPALVAISEAIQRKQNTPNVEPGSKADNLLKFIEGLFDSADDQSFTVPDKGISIAMEHGLDFASKPVGVLIEFLSTEPVFGTRPQGGGGADRPDLGQQAAVLKDAAAAFNALVKGGLIVPGSR